MADESSDEGESRGARGMAFTESTDFRGEWGADGEFYAQGGARKRQKVGAGEKHIGVGTFPVCQTSVNYCIVHSFNHSQKMTKEEAIYGVFGDDDDDGGSSGDDDDLGGGRRGRGNKRDGKSSAARLSKPMAFVSQQPTRGNFDSGAAATEAAPRAGLGAAREPGVFDRADDGDDGINLDSSDDEGDGNGDDDDDYFGRQRGRGGADDDDDDDGDTTMAGLGGGGGTGRGRRSITASGDADSFGDRRGKQLGNSRGNISFAGGDEDDDDESAIKKGEAGLTNAAFRALLSGVAPPPPTVVAPTAPLRQGAGNARGLGGMFAAHLGGAPASAAAAAAPRSSLRPAGSVAAGTTAASSGGAAPAAATAAPLPKGMGAFEKHTKGFASKYLEKFGFAGRLGKEAQGIVQPIAVQVRPDRLGLSFGDFREASRLKANQAVHADFYKKEGGAPLAADEEDERADGEGRDLL